MTAIINDLLFKLHFLCIPMHLEPVAEFDTRMDGMANDEAEQQLQKLTDTIMDAMSTKEAIHDALPSDLLDVLNNSYICHLSPLIDYLGCKEDQPEWVTAGCRIIRNFRDDFLPPHLGPQMKLYYLLVYSQVFHTHRSFSFI